MQSVIEELQNIDDFNKLLPFLKNRMGWPIEQDILDEDDPLEEATFEFTPRELGIDPAKAPNIRGIRQLRPFHAKQPFGVFLISFEDKDLKVTAMRRILRALVKKKREASNAGTQQRWDANDLMFVSNFGQSGHRKISFAHFHQDNAINELPTLRVIGWDEDDTPTRLRIQASDLTQKLKYPDNPSDVSAWRAQWNDAFYQKPGQVISTTKALVTRLAQLATQTREAIEDVLSLENKSGALHGIMNAFQESIFPDLKSEGFADMYAQTVAYGLLQARISRISGGLVLDDAANVMGATNPFLKQLFESFLSVGENKSKLDFDEIGLSQVRDLLAEADMEQVLADFENKNPNQDPKIHLYENFLKEYDKDRKDSHGVFYTPREVVVFIVRSIHETLQSDFGLADGLADTTTWAEFAHSHRGVNIPEGWADKPFVQILDPATGTGTFLIETIEIIHNHLVSKWGSEGKSSHEIQDLWQRYVPAHLLPRLRGFELMMAPYAMAHLGITLKLDQTGYKHVEGAPRAEVYLTNSLAEPFDSFSQLDFMADALADEGRGANRVKVDVPITVIIGNPPYSSTSQNMSSYARSLVERFKFVDKERISEKGALQFEKNINEDYVKFLGFAMTHIDRRPSVLGFILNNSFLDSATLRGLRNDLIRNSNKVTITNLHGDADKREKDAFGKPDQNVFDIKKGVCIAVISSIDASSSEVEYLSIKGTRPLKFNQLSKGSNSLDYQKSVINEPYFVFSKTSHENNEYFKWPLITELMPLNSTGFESGRDEILVDYSESELITKILMFSKMSDIEAKTKYSIESGWGKKLFELRSELHDEKELSKLVRPFLIRPFDVRFCLYRKDLLKTNSDSIGKHLWPTERASICILSMRQVSLEGDFSHIGVTNYLPNNRAFYSTKGKVSGFPLFYEKLPGENFRRANLNLKNHRIFRDAQENIGEDLPFIFAYYLMAVSFSFEMRTKYSEELKSEFFRVPVPKSTELIESLVPIGKQLVELHLLNSEHPKLSQPSIVFRGQGDNRLFKKPQIKWDNGKMPINDTQWFEDVPQESVDFSIGGYKPLQKWLHDRAETGGANPAQGRILSENDILHYRRMVVAITETRRLMAKIDNLINDHGGWPNAFLTENSL